MHKYIVERDIPEIGSAARKELRKSAKKSNEVLRDMGPGIQWVESYVADDKPFACTSPTPKTSSTSTRRQAVFPPTR